MKKHILFLILLSFLTANSMIMAQSKDEQTMFNEAYTLQKSDLKFANMVYNSRSMSTKPILHSIEQGQQETKVTFIQPIYFDRQWLHFGKGIKIVNRGNGDEYNVRGYADGIPFSRLLIVKDCDKKCIFITLVFPKLKRNVERIDILELSHEDDLIPSNDDGMPKSYYNIKVKDYLVAHKKTKKVFK